MTGYVSTPDYATLPAALLDMAKRHMRVDFPDDDESITDYLKWAISYFEKSSGQLIFGAQVVWSPTMSASAWGYPVPVQPVSAFTVTSGGVDVSSEYQLQSTGDPVAPVYLVHSDRTPFPADAAISLTGGYTVPDQIDPSMLGTIMRVTAKLYEYRESVSELSLEDVPFWMNDLLTGHWIPRA